MAGLALEWCGLRQLDWSIVLHAPVERLLWCLVQGTPAPVSRCTIVTYLCLSTLCADARSGAGFCSARAHQLAAVWIHTDASIT